MLKFIRRNAAAAWVKIMFLAIVIVFVFWGVGGIMESEKAQIVARINGEVIDQVDFSRAYNNLIRVYRDVYKDSFNPELAQALNLKGRAVDQLVSGSLLRQEAERLGLRVSATEVRDAIAALPTFQVDGRFNKELYLRALRANRLTPGEFEDAQREELQVRKLEELIAGGAHVSEAEVRDRYEFDNAKVNLRFVKLDADAVAPEVTFTDEDVQAYFDKQKESFREPERVQVEYVLYAADKFVDAAEVSDPEIQQYYDDRRTEFATPQALRARHILFEMAPGTDAEITAEVRRRAEEVLAKANAGEDFAALAREYSDDATAAEGGDMGFFSRGEMLQPFEEAAFALAPGEISEIVETAAGLHIIKVEVKKEASTRPLEQVRTEIVSALKQEKSGPLARAAAAAAQQKVAAGEPLGSVAQAAGFEVATPAPFGKNEAVEGLGGNVVLTNAAFSLEAGQTGPVVDTPEGFVVFRVTQKIASRIPELSEVRDRVEDAVRAERAAERARTTAEAVLAELQQGDLDAVAQAHNLEVQETGPFSRRDTYVAGIGNAPEAKNDAFQLTPEKPVAPRVYAVPGGSVVVMLKERLPADEEGFTAEKDNLFRQAEQRREAQAMEEFMNYLKARASVDLDQTFLASVPDTGRPFGPALR